MVTAGKELKQGAMTENYGGDLMRRVREGLSEKVILKLRTEKYEGASHMKQNGGVKFQANRTLKCKHAYVGKYINAWTTLFKI